MRKVLLSLLLTGALCATAFAQNPINRREHRERTLIRKGIQRGEITKQEARHLRKEQQRIERLEDRAKSDGNITRKEARKLDRALDKARRDIYKQSHDKQDNN